jgi:hypothetical protein
MKTVKIASAVFATLILSQLTLFGQAGPPPGSGAPIDGGLVLLVMGAAVYGYRKLKKDHTKEDL